MLKKALPPSTKIATFEGLSLNRHASRLQVHRYVRALTLILGVTLCSCALPSCQSESDTAANSDGSLAKGSTDAKSLTYVLTGDGPIAAGDHDLELLLLDSNGKPVDGLSVVVVPFMPAMGHGSPANPTVVPKGDGLYSLSGVMLEMSGYWVLNVEITGQVTDTVTIGLDVS